MRATPQVRPADRDDLVVVAALSASARPASPAEVTVDLGGEEALRNHLSVYLAAGGQLLVADIDGHVVGFVLARTVEPHLFATEPAIVVDTLFVTPDTRRRGVGHALIAGIAAIAGEAGSPYVYAGAPSGDRAMQRFLARLGFAPAAGHRVVPTPVLLRRLAQESTPAWRDTRPRLRRETTRAAIDDLIARRRRARDAGLPTGALDLRVLQEQQPDGQRSAS
ncbi:MAG: GNAT family N-acetyltransferase [Promicromonosporaceae bacterium]|nr:GNAT family N-acetyltransferase [Promicromonosporaceae bacterium]